jgi:hypothetical protein
LFVVMVGADKKGGGGQGRSLNTVKYECSIS